MWPDFNRIPVFDIYLLIVLLLSGIYVVCAHRAMNRMSKRIEELESELDRREKPAAQVGHLAAYDTDADRVQ